jgi:tetratricopeptide (TPR) repeat protein
MLKQHPYMSQIWCLTVIKVGVLLRDLGYVNEALQIFLEVFNVQNLEDGDYLSLILQLGLTYLCLNDQKTAEQYYQFPVAQSADESTQVNIDESKTVLRKCLELINQTTQMEFEFELQSSHYCKSSVRIIIENGRSCMNQKQYTKALYDFETSLMIYENMSENVECYKEEVRIHIGHAKMRLGKFDEALLIFKQILEPNREPDILNNHRLKGVLLSLMFCEHNIGNAEGFSYQFCHVMKSLTLKMDLESDNQVTRVTCDGSVPNKSDIILYKIGQLLNNGYSPEQVELFETHLNNMMKEKSDKKVIKKLPGNFANRYKSFHNVWRINQLMSNSCNDLNHTWA